MPTIACPPGATITRSTRTEDGEGTPWYPTLRLFRQHRDGDWPGVVRRVAQALTTLASDAAAGQAAPCRTVLAPLSPADLLDRITILEVKAERIRDAAKQANVRRELALLRRAREGSFLPWGDIAELEGGAACHPCPAVER